jgi:Transglycosylase SLT domain
LSPNRTTPVVPLFDLYTSHSFVPIKVRATGAGSGGPGRSSDRRASASPLTAASTMAALRSLGTIMCFVAMSASSMLLSGAAHAERALSITQQATTHPANPFAAFVAEASKRFAVPEHWIHAVMRVESGVKVRARSGKGAMGLMQIMPPTWTELRARYGLGADPYDPRDNILAGAAYIRELHDRYGAPGFLAAYNAGPRRYENHLATGRPLPDETKAYVVNRLAGRLSQSRSHLLRLVHRYSSCAPRAAPRTTARHPVCGQTAHQGSVPLSIYRPSCPSQATCSFVVAARSDRNDPDRASSQSVVGYRVF